MLPHRWGNRGPQKKQVYKWTYMEDPLFSILWFCDTCANLLDTILVCASENGYKRVQVPAFIWSCSYGHVGILECPVPQGPVMPWPHCTTPSGVQETTCAHAAPMRRGSATKWHPARCGSPRWPKHRYTRSASASHPAARRVGGVRASRQEAQLAHRMLNRS